jgi:hypothetical protein
MSSPRAVIRSNSSRKCARVCPCRRAAGKTLQVPHRAARGEPAQNSRSHRPAEAGSNTRKFSLKTLMACRSRPRTGKPKPTKSPESAMIHPSTYLVASAKHAVRCSDDVLAGQAQPIIDVELRRSATYPATRGAIAGHDARWCDTQAEPNPIMRGVVVATAAPMRWPVPSRRRQMPVKARRREAPPQWRRPPGRRAR